MAFKSVSCWSAPRAEDVEEFERYYTEVHVPFAARVPLATRLVLTRLAPGPDGAEPSFYRVAELYFDSREDLLAAASTPEWADMSADGAKVHDRFGVTLQGGWGVPEEVETAPGAPTSTDSRM